MNPSVLSSICLSRRVLARSTSSLRGRLRANSSMVLSAMPRASSRDWSGLQTDKCHDESRIVHVLHVDASADGFLVIHQGLVEPARGVVAEMVASTLSAAIRVRGGRNMVEGSAFPGCRPRGVTSRSARHPAWLLSVRLFENARGARDGAQRFGDPGQRLGAPRTFRRWSGSRYPAGNTCGRRRPVARSRRVRYPSARRWAVLP